MKRIYKVEFDEKWAGCEWVSNHINVLANGDMQHAVAKAKKHSLMQKFTDENGRPQRCVGFRATGVEVVAEAEI